MTGIGQRYQVNQLVGAYNSRPAREVAKAVGTFVEEINNRVRGATRAESYQAGSDGSSPPQS